MVRRILAILGLLVVAVTFSPVLRAAADADSQSVRTESGRMRCYVNAKDVGHGGGSLVVCSTYGPDSTGFPQAPVSGTAGFHYNLAEVTDTGAFNWEIGNIPGSPEAQAKDITLNYGQTYHINGWTILPNVDGTRFTNDGTGHGMFVSIENVYSF